MFSISSNHISVKSCFVHLPILATSGSLLIEIVYFVSIITCKQGYFIFTICMCLLKSPFNKHIQIAITIIVFFIFRQILRISLLLTIINVIVIIAMFENNMIG